MAVEVWVAATADGGWQAERVGVEVMAAAWYRPIRMKALCV